MSFRSFKKELERKKQQDATTKELESAIRTLTKKRDHYIDEAKKAYQSGNMSQYTAMTALLKNAVFNLKQAQDMATNFTIARDMCEMQTLNKHFVRSLKSVMDDVYKTCRAVRVSNGEKAFMRAMYQQNLTSVQLQQALQNNHVTFSSNVSTLSDISDEEIEELLQVETRSDFSTQDSVLTELENRYAVPTVEKNEPMMSRMGGSDVPAPVERPVPVPVPAPAPVSTSTPEPAPVSVSASVATPPPVPAEPGHTEAPAAEDREVSLKADLADNGDDNRKDDGVSFVWDKTPAVGLDGIAGLAGVKEAVRLKVLLPLQNPGAFEGYEWKRSGGLCLYGSHGVGKAKIAAAIAKELGAEFCPVRPSDLLWQGEGDAERALRVVRDLFDQARQRSRAVIFFDEMDAILPGLAHSQYEKQLRSELLAQLDGLESYRQETGRLLFPICSTSRPWDMDSAVLSSGRFDTRIYVGLPDAEARSYLIGQRFDRIRQKAVVTIRPDVDTDVLTEKTEGFNGADLSRLLDRMEELSVLRSLETGEKAICAEDFERALEQVHPSVSSGDDARLMAWGSENGQR